MEKTKEVAKALVREIPAPQLRRVITNIRPGIQLRLIEAGNVCGSGCADTGNVCGSGCGPQGSGCLLSPGTVLIDAFDQQGRLGLTTQDFEEIRADLPSLRREITEELNNTLNNIKTLES
jgi:hypothetical protein